MRFRCIGDYFERYNRIFKEGFWIILGQVFSIFGSLYLTRIITNNLSVDEFGELALALSIASFSGQIVMGGLINGFSRFFSIAHAKDDLYNYWISVRNLLTKASLFLLILFLVPLVFRLNVFRYYNDYVISLIFIFTVLGSFHSSYLGILGAARKRMNVTIYTCLELSIKIVLIFLFYLLGSVNILTILISNAIAILLVLILETKSLNNVLKKSGVNQTRIPTNWESEIWKFSYPFSIWGVFTSLQVSSDKWALKNFSDLRSLGAYSIVYQFGWAPISLVSSLLMTIVAPIMYSRAGVLNENNKSSANAFPLFKLTLLSLMCTLLAFICALFFHRYFFQILVSEDYREFSYLLPYVILAGGLFSTGQLLSIKLLTDLNPNKLKNVKILTSVLGVLLNTLAAYFGGLIGVVISLNIFSLTYFTAVYVLSARENGRLL
jgi:O-antigen/teichoic acid export membrane protein